jgi:hypothetical protein
MSNQDIFTPRGDDGDFPLQTLTDPRERLKGDAIEKTMRRDPPLPQASQQRKS